jgi:hypothetical protein
MVIPLMAFEPDIKGVCRVGGTLVITSKPTNTASMKIVKLLMSMAALSAEEVFDLVGTTS